MRSFKFLSGQKPREIAAEVLGRRTGRDYVEDLLELALERNPLPMNDRRLCQELAYGIVRNQSALDWLIARKTQGRVQKPGLQILLRLGLYQIFWLDRIPNHAAVHETVELAKKRGFGPQAGFVNAVLRGYVREVDSTRLLLEDLRTQEPWTGYSHPEWLVRRWLVRFGKEQTVRLLELNNTPPETFARINTLKTNAERLLPLWREENVEYDFVRHDWLPNDLVFGLKSHPPFKRLASFQQGLFYLQDPSTLLAVTKLGARSGERILDACAAPGGKLSHIVAEMGNEGQVVATDIDEHRLGLVRENCKRLGLSCVVPALHETLAKEVTAQFDRILIDAPCSNTGVMRRRVDLRWRIRPEELPRLRAEQTNLLEQTSFRLKPGGVLVYSTCSIEPEENQQVVGEFLEKHPGWKLAEERELYPFNSGTDGAYAVRLTKPLA